MVFKHAKQQIMQYLTYTLFTAQKMKFSIKDFFSKCDQIRRKLRIWSHLLMKSLMENFIFCAVVVITAVKNREKSCSIFLGFAKVSDRVNHDILVKKLKYHGICGLSLNW